MPTETDPSAADDRTPNVKTLPVVLGGLGGTLLAAAGFVDWRNNGPLNRWWYAAGGAVLAAAIVFAICAVGVRRYGWSLSDADGLLVVDDGIPPSIGKTLFRESEAMAGYALASGIEVPARALETLNRVNGFFERQRPSAPALLQPGDTFPVALPTAAITDLVWAHVELTRIVAPATPRTLRLLSDGTFNRVFPFLGRIRLVRHFEYVAVVLLGTFIGSAFKADFTGSGAPFLGTGSTGVYNAINLVAAAGLGAAFFGLYRANQYVGRGTYDNRYEPSYWARFTLGIIAGVILALVIPIGEPETSDAAISAAGTGGVGTVVAQDAASAARFFTKPLLALIGGFSADVVYRILMRLVETLETLVQGSARDLVAAQTDVIAAREANRTTQARTALAGVLLELDAKLAEGSTEEARERLRQTVQDLLPATGAAPPTGTAQTTPKPRPNPPRRRRARPLD